MLLMLMVLAVLVVIVCAATGVWGAAGDVTGDGVAGDVDGDGAAGGYGATLMLAVPTVRVLRMMLDVGALQVRCRVSGDAPCDSVVDASDGEGVVGDALGGSVAGEAGGEEMAIVRSGVMVGSSVWVVSGSWAWLVVWCSVCVAGAGYLRSARWRGCADGGGLSALWRRVAPWSWCRRCAVACVSGWVPLCVAMAGGSVRWVLGWCGWVWVRVLTCTWCELLGVCGRWVCCCRACGGLCRLVERGWCVLCVDGVGPGRRGWCRCGCLGLGAGCVCVVCAVDWSAASGGVVRRDGGFSGVCGRLVVGVAGGVVSGAGGWGRVGVGWACWWWLWLDYLVVAVSVAGPDGGPRVFGGGWACMVVVAGWCGLGSPLRVLLGVVPLGVWFVVTGHSPLWAARARWSGSPLVRQAVRARQVLTRPSGRRLFLSRQGLDALPNFEHLQPNWDTSMH